MPKVVGESDGTDLPVSALQPLVAKDKPGACFVLVEGAVEALPGTRRDCPFGPRLIGAVGT